MGARTSTAVPRLSQHHGRVTDRTAVPQAQKPLQRTAA
jgi:hypothetical protein